ncbi:LysR family transcriptional regulator [Plastoroseomonas hellenica]|uniref:LysR family transcriptional regulator n=1 Tax=Plastoroseomonas hellenica TaxID=2687306 RepID=UPI001BA7C124|nr:LysR family transcriptional regulator [Plastoroseomonas hellenica]MBR0641653.1 LysR family transcriptional regulator [Plastoroseomonas hellenica]
MTDRRLRYFLAVIRAGSIRGAAEALHVAASAVSRQIAELELDCGSPLLERLPRGVVPTEAGRIVAAHAERQEDDAALLEDRLRRLRGAEDGTVRLCCGGGFLTDLLDNGLAGFTAAHPGIACKVTLGTTEGILDAVAEGDADLGLAYNPASRPGLRSAAMVRQPLAAILLPDHSLARARRSARLKAFVALPAALLPPGHGVRQMLSRVEADGGFRLTMRLETGSFELQRRFVLAGMGVAFLPEFAAAPELREGRLAAIRLVDPFLSHAAAHLVVKAGRTLPEAAERMAAWLGARLLAFGAAH